MPTTSSIAIPDATGTSQSTEVLVNAAGFKSAVTRVLVEKKTITPTIAAATYQNGQLLSGLLTFPAMADNTGWGGFINGGAINLNNTTLSADTISLVLFSSAIASTLTPGTLLTALTLTDAEWDSFVDKITFANPTIGTNRVALSLNTINLPYVCDTTTSLFGFLVLNSAANRILASTRANITLGYTKA